MDSTKRFSHTVDNYLRYRPSYPKELLNFLAQKLGLTSTATIADIGSGTGKLTELFLKNGNPTYAVEPNTAMREAAEQLFSTFPNFYSINGTAEATTLPDASIDFITAAQAFHWFQPEATRQEFQRILKPSGLVALIWNDRLDNRSTFMQGYEDFLQNYNVDLNKIDLRNISDDDLDSFFGDNPWELHTFEHYQEFDLEGVKGRYWSSSYALRENHPYYTEALANLTQLFHTHAEEGKIKMWYVTKVYIGTLEAWYNNI